MKNRRHHNNTGLPGIKAGIWIRSLRALAKKMKIPFKVGKRALND